MLQNKKMMGIYELSEEVERLKAKNKKIVHCHGVFDLLHIGHIRYFEQACRMGDVLVVTLTSDSHVDKGPHRPAFTESLRAEAVASLDCVDYVAVNMWPTAEETLRLLKPDVYVKGSEFKNIHTDLTGKIAREAKVIKDIGATLAFTEDIVFSSTNLINRYLTNMPKVVSEYLELFRKRFSLGDILEILEKMSSLNVLVIGDTIIDEYQYCEAIGKSSKDPMLALKYQSHDLFAGGVLAVANHVAKYANNVQMVTVIGEKESYEDFIKSQLDSNISIHYVIQPNAPTLIKRRFIDGYSFNKLFEVYVMDDSGLAPTQNHEVCNWLEEQVHKYDLVIAADFGHGAISDEMVKILVKRSRFLAVNTQANAGNRGFHSISRYSRMNYACIAEHELRLETRSQNGSIRPYMEDFSRKIGCSQFVVTRGRKGCAICDKDGGFVKVPAFDRNVVDRVGAGDAFLSVTSLASIQGVSNEILGFLGNVVGALAVEILGNKKSIDKSNVQKYIMSLMK